ncbi:hypothetical protein BH11PLA1_BH11PLA1_19200 [soil metagenome]
MNARLPAWRGAAVPALAALALLAACAVDEPTIIYKQRNLFEGIPGAMRGGEEFTGRGGAGKGAPASEGKLTDLVRNEGGREVLVSRRPRHVMVHLCLRLDEKDRAHGEQLFAEQLISQRTREQFISEGKDPGEIVPWLQTNYDDIMRLFQKMPAGEVSPGVIFERQSGNLYSLRLTGTIAKTVRLTELFLEQDRGVWKFVWVR